MVAANKRNVQEGLLSIIVPVYNAEKHLNETVNSLVQQTYPNKEIILIDDGSTDNSPAICDSYAAKNECVRVVHKKNEGVVATRNRGIEESRGEYITLPDNDDVLDCQAYEILIDAIVQTDSDAAACCVKTEYSTRIVTPNKQQFIPAPYIYNGSANILAGIGAKEHDLSGFQWNKVFKREAIGDIRFRPVFICDDTLLCYEVFAKANRVVHIDLPLYHYRYVSGSDSKSGKIGKFMNCLQAQEELIRWCSINAPQCMDSVVKNHLFWNTKSCESMLKNPDMEAFARIQENVKKYQAYIPKCSLRIRLLSKAITASWHTYKPLGMLFWHLKKLYVALHRIL